MELSRYDRDPKRVLYLPRLLKKLDAGTKQSQQTISSSQTGAAGRQTSGGGEDAATVNSWGVAQRCMYAKVAMNRWAKVCVVCMAFAFDWCSMCLVPTAVHVLCIHCGYHPAMAAACDARFVEEVNATAGNCKVLVGTDSVMYPSSVAAGVGRAWENYIHAAAIVTYLYAPCFLVVHAKQLPHPNSPVCTCHRCSVRRLLSTGQSSALCWRSSESMPSIFS